MAIDTLNQGGKDVILPADVKARVENARNNVTVMEAETARLQKLAKEYTDKIAALRSEEAELDKKIGELNQKLDTLIDTIAHKQAHLKETEESLKFATGELRRVTDESQAISAEQTKRSAELDSRETSLKNYDEDVNARAVDLIEKESAFSAKVEKLKAVLQDIG